jgi:short-subunit dehydrogenase
MKTYSEKTALITGASMGIGASLSYALAARGTRLILVARSNDLLDQLAIALHKMHGTNVTVIAMDLTRPGAVADLYADVTGRGLAVDLLVNNAGFGKWGHFLDSDAATYNEMIELNVKAVVDLCHVFLPGMAARGDCGILNVGSVASYMPIPWSAVYAATKAFILSFSEARHGCQGRSRRAAGWQIQRDFRGKEPDPGNPAEGAAATHSAGLGRCRVATDTERARS